MFLSGTVSFLVINKCVFYMKTKIMTKDLSRLIDSVSTYKL